MAPFSRKPPARSTLSPANDQGIEHQQPAGQDIAMRFTVFEAPTNQIEHPLPLVAPAQEALRETAPGEVRHVEAPA
jgi:hypothetical protein